MITSLFKNNIFSYLLASIIGVLLWAIAYFEVTLDIPVSINIANQECFLSKKTAILLSFFVTLFGGILLNFKLKKYLFSYEPTNLFLFFYILIASLGLQSNNIIAYSLVSFLLVLMINYLIYFIENKKQEDQVFNSSFIIGLLIFQNLFFVILIPLLLLNLGAVKRISIKELALIIIGFLLPTIFVILFTILTENIEILETLFQVEINFPKIPWKFGLYFLVLIFISIKGYRLLITKRSGIDINITRLTKNMFVFFIAMAIIVGLSLFSFQKEYVAFIFAIPLSVFLAGFFANSSFRYRELIFLIVILIPILIRFTN
jgi:hypothetical protein